MTAVNPKSLKFAPIPDMPTCATGAIIRGDPRSGPAWVMLKLASGCKVPWHWHSANEDLVVISGQGTLTAKDGQPLPFAPGAYASLPKQHVHQANCKRTCILFSIADGAFDIHYVDASGKEMSADKALGPAKTKLPKK
jgi:quercetin dioxygenase-like cupin family protein